MATLAENVRYYREKAGLSQDGLARATGISKNHIGNIEQAITTSPRGDTLAQIAAALDVTIDDLWGTSTHPNRASA